MKRKALTFTAFGLALGILIVAVTGALLAQRSDRLQPATSAEPAAQTEPHPAVELYTFGDENTHAILLDLVQADAEQPIDYKLTFASPEAERLSGSYSESIVCSQAATPISTPPSHTRAAPGFNSPSFNPVWSELARWLSGPSKNSYTVEMWAPASQANEFVLVSGEATSAFGKCSILVDEDV